MARHAQLWRQAVLDPAHPRFEDLEARGLLRADGPSGGLADIIKRTRKAFLMEGPALHIFVVTLRCDHACQYCQVSRASLDTPNRDMSDATARAALDRVFESDAPTLTIEFQGGEPSLRFDLVRTIVENAEAHPHRGERPLRFTMATTLHRLGMKFRVLLRSQWIMSPTAPEPSAPRRGPGTAEYLETIPALASQGATSFRKAKHVWTPATSLHIGAAPFRTSTASVCSIFVLEWCHVEFDRNRMD